MIKKKSERGRDEKIVFSSYNNLKLISNTSLLMFFFNLFYLFYSKIPGFRNRRFLYLAPGSQSSKYSSFVNKLFSNVPRVIEKYMLSLTRAIIYLQGVLGFRSRRFL